MMHINDVNTELYINDAYWNTEMYIIIEDICWKVLR